MKRSELIRRLCDAAPGDTDPEVSIVADGIAWTIGDVEAYEGQIDIVEESSVCTD
jgi:hypothetical protein